MDADGSTDVGENRARAEGIGAPPGRKHYFNVIVVSSFPLVRAVPYLSRGRVAAARDSAFVYTYTRARY